MQTVGHKNIQSNKSSQLGEPYDDRKSHTHYQRPFIAVPVNQQLRKLYPDRFTEIDAYNNRIEGFEKAIAESEAKKKRA